MLSVGRMEAALAEFQAEDVGEEQEDDVDFILEKDEEDAFGSDFESTDEEAVQADIDAAAERIIREEERTVRKSARSKLDKVTAAAHARQKATFKPQDRPSESRERVPSSEAKVKRRVSLGVVVDAETGEVVERAKRQSSRRHTMMNTSATVSRLKDEQEKKSALPKKVKTKVRAPTQTELIARALDMEEGNISEHRNYLTLEEEKRKQARLVRTTVQGQRLRWVSKCEEVKIKVEPPPPPPPPAPPQTAPYGNTYPRASSPYTYTPTATSTSYFHPSSYAYAYPSYAPSSTAPSYSYAAYPYQGYAQPSASIPPPASSSLPSSAARMPAPPVPASPASPLERTEKVTKNYIIHELDQSDGTPKPTWHRTMRAMFGDHVKWEELRVYTSKGRPLARPIQTCPITGKAAPYRDPRTGAPFADLEAYRTLSHLLEHEYVWSDSLGCYIGRQGDDVI